ncbi:hypothetical protein QR680_016664 [Steinernema hermaphroditum]|uniref:guanylate cyclase n=1 Tax=Steinernema hermaphroditum TaxID=289476 RepID=A0AA39HCW4_9BILA|nr:hypothetical protein QR680_016664 [Steinernema hermaphroditum]
MSFPHASEALDSGWGALRTGSSSESEDEFEYDDVDIGDHPAIHDDPTVATTAAESFDEISALVASVPSTSTAQVAPVSADLAHLLAVNEAYLDIIENIIARVERAKEQNRTAQQVVAEQHRRRKNSVSCDKGYAITPHLLFLPPYFKNHHGMVPAANPEAKKRLQNKIYDPLLGLHSSSWTAGDCKTLYKAVRQELITSRLEPLNERKQYLADNIRHNVVNVDPELRAGWMQSLSDVMLKIDHIKALPDEELFQGNYDGVNFARIATQMFHGSRSELECKYKWLNEVSPRWSKEAWTKEEVDELRSITENSFLSWDVVAAKLRTGRTPFQCFQKYQNEVIFNEHFTKPWTVEEDEKLKSLVDTFQTQQYKCIPFKKVASFMEGRTERQVQRRYHTIISTDRKTGRWTEEEDCYLLTAVDKYGEKNWDKVASEVKGRLAHQCRERYINVLHKNVKHTEWTLAEDEKLLYLTGLFKRYNEARFFIKGRTAKMCSNRLKMLLRLKVRRCVAEVCDRDGSFTQRNSLFLPDGKAPDKQLLRPLEWRKRTFAEEVQNSYECISEFVKAEQHGAKRKRRLEARLGLGGNVINEDGCEELRPAQKYYVTHSGRKVAQKNYNPANCWESSQTANPNHPFQSMTPEEQAHLIGALEEIDKKYEHQDYKLDDDARAELLHHLVHDYIHVDSGIYEKHKINIRPSSEELAARNRRRLNRRDYTCIAIPKDIPEPDRKMIAMNELCRMIAICEKNDTRHYYRINRVNVLAAESAKDQLKAMLIDNVNAFVPRAPRVEPVNMERIKEYLDEGGNLLPPCVPSINAYYNFSTKYREILQKQAQRLFTPFTKDGIIADEADMPQSSEFVRHNIRLSEDIVNSTEYQSLRLRLYAMLLVPIIMERAIDTEENRETYRALAAKWDELSRAEMNKPPVNMTNEERATLVMPKESPDPDAENPDAAETQSQPDCNNMIANELLRLSQTESSEEMTLSQLVAQVKRRSTRRSYQKLPSTSKARQCNAAPSQAAGISSSSNPVDGQTTQPKTYFPHHFHENNGLSEMTKKLSFSTKRRKAFALCGGALVALLGWITVAQGVHEVRVGLVVDHDKLADGKTFFERSVSEIQSRNTAKEYSFRVLTDEKRGCGVDRQQGDGAFVAANLYFRQKITSLFGPMCHSDLEITGRLSNQWNIIQFNFWRDHHMDIDLQTVVQMSTSSAVNFAVNLATLLNSLNWNKIALFTCEKCDDEDLTQNRLQIVRRVLDSRGMQIVQKCDLTPQQMAQPGVLADILNKTKLQMRIMVPFFGRDLTHYGTFVEAVKISKLDPEQYVTILTVFYDKVNITLPWMNGDQVNETVKESFDRSIVMVNEYYHSPKAVEFIRTLSAQDPVKALGYLQLYESIHVDLTMLEKASNASGQPEIFRNGSFIRGMMRNLEVEGPFGPIYLDSNTQRLSPFAVYYVEPKIARPVPFVTIRVETFDAHTGEELVNLGSVGVNSNVSLMADIPPDMPTCGFNNELCDQSGTIIVIASVMAFVVASIIMFIIFRKIKTGEAKNMPWALPASSIRNQCDRNGSSMLSMGSVQNKGFSQSANDAVRFRELVMADVVPAVCEVYGTKDRIVFDKTDMMLLYQMKQIVHENLNVFIGLVTGKVPEPLKVVWSCGYRGTIENLLLSKKTQEAESGGGAIMPMDDSIKGAFVRDILKGLIYLHTSPLQYHGALCPAQCFVDQYWVVKLSGFGVYKMLYKWKNNSIVQTNGGRPLIPNADIHYYSPERRMGLRQFVQTNRFESLGLTEKNGQQYDMYSFGMILYEILTLRKWSNLDDFRDTPTEPSNTSEEENSFFNESAEAQLPKQFAVSNDEETKEIHPDLLGIITKCVNSPMGQKPNAENAKKIIDSALKTPPSLVDQMLSNMEQYTTHLEQLVSERTKQLMEAMEHSTALLREMLPAQVADELRKGNRVAPKYYKQASILYSDIVGFTSMCSESTPMEVVTLLGGLFKKFDQIIADNDCYKVETIGDAYMIASGIPIEKKVENVRDIALVGLGMRDFLRHYEIPHRPGNFLQCRWGINTGPVFTGVIGTSAPRYCVFGATASLAAQMESMGMPGHIQMAFATNQLLTNRFPEFRTQPRQGGLTVQGVGHLLTYWLLGRIDALVDPSDEDLTLRKPLENGIIPLGPETERRPTSRIDGPMTQTL